MRVRQGPGVRLPEGPPHQGGGADEVAKVVVAEVKTG